MTITRKVAAALAVSWCLGTGEPAMVKVRAADDVARRITLRGEPLAWFFHEGIDEDAGSPVAGVVPTSSSLTAETAQTPSPGRRPQASWWWAMGIGAAAGAFGGAAAASHCRNEGGEACSAAIPVVAGLGALAGFLIAAR